MEIPEALKGKLEFGNTKQIKAIRQLEDELELGEYKFSIPEVGYYITNIKASSEEKARELAHDEMDVDAIESGAEPELIEIIREPKVDS